MNKHRTYTVILSSGVRALVGVEYDRVQDLLAEYGALPFVPGKAIGTGTYIIPQGFMIVALYEVTENTNLEG